ncbi:hypothetical protein B4114_1696 [Geobacillus stearothermophilus]|uniref:Uncharacterized protein n=1 Tax=Geobacillus stearothermophilus TaxID=1422 RepID=A0A150N4A3_GEOSE|nr:hypothetical protein B4114_1696 [Geobacillus stearothermophilus]
MYGAAKRVIVRSPPVEKWISDFSVNDMLNFFVACIYTSFFHSGANYLLIDLQVHLSEKMCKGNS